MDSGSLSLGIGVFAALYIALIVGAVALGFWLLYQIIWRAVRRGMREFSRERLDTAQSRDASRQSAGHATD